MTRQEREALAQLVVKLEEHERNYRRMEKTFPREYLEGAAHAYRMSADYVREILGEAAY